MSDITRSPLSWPAGRERTPSHRRQRPKFKSGSFATCRDELLAELRRAKAQEVILSTNVALRQDGLPLANQRNPNDPGVAVYFTRKSKPLSLCCDRWIAVEDNLRAIQDVVQCIRTIERRGTGEMVDAAFTGFQQLPPAANASGQWWQVMGLSPQTATAEVQERFRELVMRHHPDRGGDSDKMVAVNAAYESFKKERGL